MLDGFTQGAVSALGAAIVFGSSSLPAKHPSVGIVGTASFQVHLGCPQCVVVPTVVRHSRQQHHYTFDRSVAVIRSSARADEMGCTRSARSHTHAVLRVAIRLLGAAAGPGIWCGIGMIVSFVRGTSVFGEKVHVTASAIGLTCLTSAVAGIALAQTDLGWFCARMQGHPTLAAADQAYEEVQPQLTDNSVSSVQPSAILEQTQDLAASELSVEVDAGTKQDSQLSKSSHVLSGIGFAIATGCLDGSLMAPFSAQKAEYGRDNEQVMYMGAFGLALPLVSIPVFGVWFLVQHILLEKPIPKWSILSQAIMPGLCSGALWAAGNTMSVHATLRLGQAIGFPSTQVCVVVCALWGILYFKEIKECANLVLFWLATRLSVMLVGAFTLSLAFVQR